MHQNFAQLELPKETRLVHDKNLPWSETTHPVAYFCLCIFHHIIRDICCLAMDTNVTDSMPCPEVLHPMHRKLETLWEQDWRLLAQTSLLILQASHGLL